MPGENVVGRLDDASVLSAARVRPETRRWLLTRDFSLIWSSQILSQIADGVSKLALLWFVYSVTGSAIKTTIIGLLQTLPAIVLGPLIGVTVDRLPKKAVLIGSDLARALLIGLIPCVLSVERFTPGMLYLLTLGYGIASAMFVPALSASVPSLVDRSRFTAANALLQSTTSIGIIAGPALSGLGIAFAGSQEVLCLNAVTYVASVLCLLPIRFPGSAGAPAGHAAPGVFADLLAGLRYALVSRRAVLVLILLASLYTFGAGAFTTLFPVYGRRLLDLGPIEVGYLWSWLGVGLLIASLGLVRFSNRDIATRLQAVTVSSLLGGAALWGLVWAQDFAAATLLVLVIGAGLGAWTPIAWSLVQELCPAPLLGRVMAIYTAVATATAMAGMTFFGWVTEAFDESASVIGIGMVLAVLAAASSWFKRNVAGLGAQAAD
ncbi:MFS transporter [Nitrospira tepida]|uniref:MFS transporter n=1 Tax=Nitrospira tepida TaxID=2973512 RepID=A0AA86N073_9BACT|nr:MFS transporter [Nitrospira tepida]CAI4032333.1 MFS transporter [Nitrospira tepida]